MSERVPLTEVVDAYEGYERLANGLGLRVRKSAVRAHAAGRVRGSTRKSLFSRSYAEQHEKQTAPARVVIAVDGLAKGLAKIIRRKANGSFPKGVRAGTTEFFEAVSRLPLDVRAELAQAATESDQGEFLLRQEMSVEEFQALLKAHARGQTIARSKLVQHLREESAERGVEMSLNAIEERLRTNTKVRTVPACFAEIVASLDARFLTGLIPIEEMVGETPPEEWLEACRRKLQFRSHNAMHKALAEVTGLKYEAVHKSLTRPRAGQRIQAKIREMLAQWMETIGQGGGPPEQALRSPARSRPSRHPQGASATQVRKALMQLLSTYPNRTALCREAATALGVSPNEVKRLLTHPEDRRSFSLAGLAVLRRMHKERVKRALRISYLAASGTRKLADRLTERAQALLEALEIEPENETLRETLHSTRLQLIMAMKQRLTLEDWETPEDVAKPEALPDSDS